MVRLAKKEELERVNEIRRTVHAVHADGRPDIFKSGFPEKLSDYIYEIWSAENKEILVAEREGVICGIACVQIVDKSETPFMNARKFYDVDELGVDANFRRQGVGTELIAFIRSDARRRGIHRIELNMWEFNEGALAFYEAVGFRTYRRYMELTD